MKKTYEYFPNNFLIPCKDILGIDNYPRPNTQQLGFVKNTNINLDLKGLVGFDSAGPVTYSI
jgi:hypothetical protein